MSNVHGLFSNRKDDDESSDDENDRFVGGIGDRGGGSGLAVHPTPDEGGDRDSVFNMAESAAPEDSGQVRRTITMYRDGFLVDDGPYRRLDDPANAEFLRDLARGQTPRELLTDTSSGTAGGAGAGAGAGAAGGSVVVGLIDKRSEEYVEEFRSFMGEGNSMQPAAATAPAPAGIFDPASLPETPPAAPGTADPTTSIQIRLLSGARQVVRIALSSTVADLAAHVRSEADGSRFQLIAGFPPKPLQDPAATIQEAGLKGAQVTMKKVA